MYTEDSVPTAAAPAGATADRQAPVGVSPRRVGRVVSASGAQVVALLDPGLDQTLDIQMGTLVKMVGVRSSVFGMVEGSSIPIPRQNDAEQELRVMEISLLGEVLNAEGGGDGTFRRGVSRLPALDQPVSLADEEDTRLVYAMPRRQTIRIGSIHQDARVPAHVSVNDLLGKHFAVLGTTGTGKSCALTLVLNGILACNANAHVLLLDPHGEYGAAFPDRAEHLTAENFRLPYWLLNFEELVEVVFGAEKHSMALEITRLRELILAAKTCFAKNPRDVQRVSVDSPVPYTLGDVNRLLDEAAARLDNRSELPPYLRVKARLAALQSDPRYAFMFSSGVAVRDNLAALLGRIFRVPTNGRPLAILDLAGVPSEVLNVVVAVLCRMAFDFAMWAGQQLPLLLVCEEAHRYAPQDTALGFEPAKLALARIAKEGRKYGISLGVVSQRPSDLASSLLSQCNTVLSFRMTNHKDQEIIQATMSDASAALFSSLPLLGNGEAIAVGEGVSVPMRLRIDELPASQRPRSSSASFSDRWQADDAPASVLDSIVEGWRGQRLP